MAEPIVIGGDVYEVGELRLEKCLRLIDAIAAMQRASTTAADMIGEWTERETERRRAMFAEPEARAARRRIIEQAIDEEMPELDAAGREAMIQNRLDNPAPGFMEKLMRLLPYIWKEARVELDTLLAVAVSPIEEMEAADAQGVLDSYLAAKSRLVRYHGSISTARAILVALADRIQEEVASEGTLGEVVGGFREAVAGMVSAVMTLPASVPSGSTDSPPTTAGAAETSSTESPSAS